ncbi:MAG: ATP--guanido phosphotransferase, partial [Clostridia bacterium]|nr:ATP--guanido phosphotransferase [Clostridia bacterium]
GYQTKEALKTASDYEKLLDGRFGFAKDENLGYLTACPTNLGSGLRISAMLHLPALTMTKRIGHMLNSVGKLGLTIRGMYGEGTEARGCLYQLSNQVTLGMTDEEILTKVNSVIDQIVSIETKLRDDILKANETEIKNRVMRAYGILKNSYSLTSEEAIGYLSDVRLGKAFGIIDTEYKNISTLLVKGSPACLISEEGLKEPDARDKRRAILFKELL